MSNANEEEIAARINSLIQVCVDGVDGYRTAARDVKNSELEGTFNGYAKQRAKFIGELETELKRLGGVPDDSGSFTAALHRGWIGLKTAVTGASAAAIIAACETGEDSAVAAYERVVDSPLPGHTRALVERQWEKVKEAHAHLKHLKHQSTEGTSFARNE